MSLWSLINFGNAGLIAAILLAFLLKKPVYKIGMIVVFALFLKFRSGFDIDNFMFILSALGALALREVLPFRPQANATIAILAGLIIFNVGLIFI